MHHISAEWRYISLRAWLRGSLQWAESSERIHSSLRDNTEVSFTEELQTFRRYTAWLRERFRASTSCNGIQIEERAAQGQILNIRSSEFGFGLTQEPNGERKKNLFANQPQLQRIFDLLPWRAWLWKDWTTFSDHVCLVFWGYQRGILTERKCIIHCME